MYPLILTFIKDKDSLMAIVPFSCGMLIFSETSQFLIWKFQILPRDCILPIILPNEPELREWD